MGRPKGSTKAKKAMDEKPQDENQVVPPVAPVVEPEKPADPPAKVVKPTAEKKVKTAPEPEEKALVADETEALELFKKDYVLPEGDFEAYVTSDGNVFYQSGYNSCLAHARPGKLQIFTIKP